MAYQILVGWCCISTLLIFSSCPAFLFLDFNGISKGAKAEAKEGSGDGWREALEVLQMMVRMRANAIMNTFNVSIYKLLSPLSSPVN